MQIDVVANTAFPITYASPSFKAKYGSPGTFTEIIPQPQEFTQWLNSIADQVVSGMKLPAIEEFGSLTLSTAEIDGTTSVESLRTFVYFPKPGEDRSSYGVCIRFSGQNRGTSALVEHHALSGHAQGEIASEQANPARQLSL